MMEKAKLAALGFASPLEALAERFHRYAPGLAEGQQLKRGDVVGFVGSSGNADPAHPHLHFAIFELGPEKRWWEGRAINPYPLLVGEASAPR